MGCLFAFLGVFFPRVAFVAMWLLTPWVNTAFSGLGGLLGALAAVIFLPYTGLALIWAGNTEFGLLQIIVLVLAVGTDLGAYGKSRREVVVVRQRRVRR